MVAEKKKMRPEQERTSNGLYKKYKPVLDKMQEDSQNYLVLKHILEHGAITQKEAERKPIYSMRLSARIYDLRHDYKVPIETETVTRKRGRKVIPHARYYIGGQE